MVYYYFRGKYRDGERIDPYPHWAQMDAQDEYGDEYKYVKATKSGVYGMRR